MLNTDLDGAVERLRREMAEEDERARDRYRGGYEAGRSWEAESASPGQLRRLSGRCPHAPGYDDLGPAEELYLWIRGRLDEQDTYWHLIPGGARHVNDPEFALGFCEGGSVALWEQVGGDVEDSG
jgi:hypothetical protein